MLLHPTRGAVAAAAAKRTYICPSCLRRAKQWPPSLAVNPLRPPYRALQTHTQAPPRDDVPFRKQLKDAAKRKKKGGAGANTSFEKLRKEAGSRLDGWELTVGIEIHAELNTARKLFSAAATSVNDPPNSHVALFDMAFPGSQPHFQKETLVPALRAALALGCDIQPRSSFDRKHYFYQDQPAGYQITQYYEPFARDGHITLYPHDFPGGVSPEGGPVTIGIKQVQMEQDTAKTIQQPPSTHLLDFNRVSHPLIEIITLPQIHHPTTAAVLVKKIQAILKGVDACTAGMEMGGLRADVNVSIRRRHGESSKNGHSYAGVTGLGQRTEIKNLASVKDVEGAIIAERDRQIDLVENGGVVEGETRGWTPSSKETHRLRGKEGEIDYRYMPDPDIAPVVIGKDLVEHLRSTLTMGSDDAINMLVDPTRYGLSPKDASTLLALDDGQRLDYYLELVKHLQATFANEPEHLSRSGKIAGNWVLMELGALTKGSDWSSTRVPASELSSLIAQLLRNQITGRTAKTLLQTKFEGDARSIEQIIMDHNLELKPLSTTEYRDLAIKLIAEHPQMARDIVDKKQLKKTKWFVGQMMRSSGEGTVVPEKAEQVVREVLGLDDEAGK